VHLLRSIGKISFQGDNISWEEYYSQLGLSYENMYHYVQAGVLLFNLEKIRNDNKSNIMTDIFNKYPILAFNDQDILNIAFKGNMKLLDIRYNFYDPRNQLLHGNLGASEYNEWELAKYNPAIIHFTGGDKPWNFKKNYFLCYYKEYFKYLQLTAYKLSKIKLKLLLMLNNLRLLRRILFQIKETKKFFRLTILGVTITINWSKIFKWY
jgi:lipopolysaccharide biosynthesis glycosyltransferase